MRLDEKLPIWVQVYKINRIRQSKNQMKRLESPSNFRPPLADAFVRLKDMNRRQVKLALNREGLETEGILSELKDRLKLFYNHRRPGYPMNMKKEYLLRNDLYVDEPTRLKEFSKKDLLALAEYFSLWRINASNNKRKLMRNISNELLSIFPGAAVDANGLIILEEKMFH